MLQQVNYVYDVLGDMLSRTVTISGTSTTQKFAYDVSDASIGINAHVNPMWAELDAAGNIVTRYLMDDNGGLLARSTSGSMATMFTCNCRPSMSWTRLWPRKRLATPRAITNFNRSRNDPLSDRAHISGLGSSNSFFFSSFLGSGGVGTSSSAITSARSSIT